MLFYNIQYYSITSKTIYKLSKIAHKSVLCYFKKLLVNVFYARIITANAIN